MIKLKIPRRSSESLGASPGTLISSPDAHDTSIWMFSFDKSVLVEKSIENLDEIRGCLDTGKKVWINVDGLKNIETIDGIGKLLGAHVLAMEDVVKGIQRPKAEAYRENLFIVLKMITLNDDMDVEQISIILGKNYVATFQEEKGDCLESVRKRLRKTESRMRTNDISYLAYAIIDTIIDAYYPVLETIGEELELLEDEIIDNATRDQVSEIHDIKRTLLTMRRAVWPLRDALSTLVRDSSDFISEDTKLYLRDCYDHTIQVIDVIENFREVTSDLMGIYLSSVSNRMNEVMKVLTIIATIFIPLSFVVGLYGMNFNPEVSKWNMPELNWPFGYPLVLLFMTIMVAVMLWYFYLRGWLGKKD